MTPHLSEEALVDLLEQTEPDPHIAECLECRETLEEYRAITSCLGQEAAWDLRALKEEPVPQTIANLRAFADRMHAEDEAAVPLVAELLAGPREEWMPRLLADSKYRTAGVVRKLMEASDKAVDVMPPDALEITTLSTEIADKLDPSGYPSDTVMKLRGNAWRDRGFCLYQCSQFRESLDAIKRASALLKDTFVADYDLARAGIAQSLTHRAFDDFGSAAESARCSAADFDAYGDVNRLIAALIVEAQATWKGGDTKRALGTLLRVLGEHEIENDDTQSRLMANIAFFYRELGDIESSLKFYDVAAFLRSADASDDSSSWVIQWNVAIMIGRAGNVEEAERRMLPLMTKFEGAGMHSEAVQVGLEMSELYLERGRFDAVEVLCKKALDFYSRVGLPTTPRALTAFSFLREAARERRMNSMTLRNVRRYLDQPSEDAALLFLPPPA